MVLAYGLLYIATDTGLYVRENPASIFKLSGIIDFGGTLVGFSGKTQPDGTVYVYAVVVSDAAWLQIYKIETIGLEQDRSVITDIVDAYDQSTSAEYRSVYAFENNFYVLEDTPAGVSRLIRLDDETVLYSKTGADIYGAVYVAGEIYLLMADHAVAIDIFDYRNNIRIVSYNNFTIDSYIRQAFDCSQIRFNLETRFEDGHPYAVFTENSGYILLFDSKSMQSAN